MQTTDGNKIIHRTSEMASMMLLVLLGSAQSQRSKVCVDDTIEENRSLRGTHQAKLPQCKPDFELKVHVGLTGVGIGGSCVYDLLLLCLVF